MSFSWPCRKCGHYTANLFYTCEKCGTPEKRIPYDWARVECPVCNAPAEQRCRTRKTGRTTDAHMARVQLAYKCEPQIRRERLTELTLKAIFGEGA